MYRGVNLFKDDMDAKRAVTEFYEAVSSNTYKKAQKKLASAERLVESVTAALARVVVHNPQETRVIRVLAGDLLLAREKLEKYSRFTTRCREAIEAKWKCVMQQAYWKSVSESITVDEDFDAETLRFLKEESEDSAKAWAVGYARQQLTFEGHSRAFFTAKYQLDDDEGDGETELLMEYHEEEMVNAKNTANIIWDELCAMRIWR
jgi:hypothetical protein